MIEWVNKENSSRAEAALDSLSESGKEEAGRAASKAMQLLLACQRTEKELRRKLLEKQFSPEACDAAVAYVAAYGYLDDRRYAEVYLHSMEKKKSRSRIRMELVEKGVRTEWIEEAFAEAPDEEEEVVWSLLCKKAGEPHRLDEKELRRAVAYLERKGFSPSVIWKQIHAFQLTE